MMRGQLPQLSYSQLFSFQVAHNLVEAQQASERYRVNLQALTDLLKKVQWNRSILEVDFTNGMVFLQEKDRVIAAKPFSDFKKFVVPGEDFDDNLLSLRFTGQQWQIMTQNSTEKACLSHLLQCVAKDTSAEEAIAAAAPGILGLNKSILRAGILIRKAKTQFKKDKRYCVLVPGKLFIFKNPNLPGQRVRYVTSLMGASVRTLEGMAFQVLVPGTKILTFIPDQLDEMTGWIGALERSVEIAHQLLDGGTYEQPDEIPYNMFASMNPTTMAGLSGAGGAYVQSSTHTLGYNNPQDSMALQQRIMAGSSGGMFQQAQEVRPPFGITTPLSNTTPFGVPAPYPGNFQGNLGQGNLQNPMSGGNFQTSGGMPKQGGPLTSMPRQAGFMGQSSAGPTISYNKPQGNFNTENQVNDAMPGTSQVPRQAWDQGQQNSNALPGEAGVRRIRRATRTLRDFNNTMDQFLAEPSTSGYGGGVSQTQNPGSGWGNPQAQFQGYGTPQQAQGPWYGRGLQGQVPQSQAQWYGRGAPQAQGQQGQVQGYGGGAPQGQMHNYGAAQQAQVYGRGAPQMQNTGYGRAGNMMQNPGYGRAGSMMQNPGYGRAGSMMQNPGYGRAGSMMQNPGYGRAGSMMQNPGYGRAGSMMQNPGYGRAGSMMQNPGYGRASSTMPNPQYRGPTPGVAPDANPGDWKQFTSPDGRQYYYNERTRQTTWTRPY